MVATLHQGYFDRNNWETSTQFAGTAGMLLHIDEKFRMGVTSEAGTTYPSGERNLTPVFVGFVLLDI
jgi:hypothetical protein